ncbi:MAG: hypothetical protein AB1449_00415 [Chloroflexota bacterium]
MHLFHLLGLLVIAASSQLSIRREGPPATHLRSAAPAGGKPER